MDNTGLRLAHGWKLDAGCVALPLLIRDFIRPAVRAVPSRMARQLGLCRVSLVSSLGSPDVASQWSATDRGVDISLATADRDEHDVAMEMLVCLGQALWERLPHNQRKAYWLLLETEIRGAVTGEIDEEALREKRALMANRFSAASGRRLERYGGASFAGTAAEYVHCLWHDVEVRSGPDYLPAAQLQRRLELLSRWFPPGRGLVNISQLVPGWPISYCEQRRQTDESGHDSGRVQADPGRTRGCRPRGHPSGLCRPSPRLAPRPVSIG